MHHINAFYYVSAASLTDTRLRFCVSWLVVDDPELVSDVDVGADGDDSNIDGPFTVVVLPALLLLLLLPVVAPNNIVTLPDDANDGHVHGVDAHATHTPLAIVVLLLDDDDAVVDDVGDDGDDGDGGELGLVAPEVLLLPLLLPSEPFTLICIFGRPSIARPRRPATDDDDDDDDCCC
jgi:hypothetical protein